MLPKTPELATTPTQSLWTKARDTKETRWEYLRGTNGFQVIQHLPQIGLRDSCLLILSHRSLAAFDICGPFPQHPDRLIRQDGDSPKLFRIRLACGWEWYKSSKRERVGNKDVVVFTLSLAVGFADGVGRTGLALGADKARPIGVHSLHICATLR